MPPEHALILLPIRLDPQGWWEQALGYWGDARFLGVYLDCGKAQYTDGRLTATALWQGFACFASHPYARSVLRACPVNDGEDSLAPSWLIVDRRQRRLYVAPNTQARRFLENQWPQAPGEMAVFCYESIEELMQLAEKQMRQYEAEQQQHQQAQQNALARLGMWLELQISQN